MKKILPVILMLVLVVTLVLGGCSKSEPSSAPAPASPTSQTPAPQAPIKLTFVSFLPATHFEVASWKPLFIDEINKRANGKLVIEYKGGPEVVPAAEIALAVSQGQIDMCDVATGLATGVIPGLDTIRLSEISVKEERQNGTYDYIRKLSGDAKLYFVGRQEPTNGNFFYLFFKKPVTSKNDFPGRTMASTASFFGVLQALGLTPKPVDIPDYYSSLESGVVDGIATALATWDGSSLFQVCPLALDTPFYKNQVCIFCNANSWNKLPDDMKKLIDQVQIEAEAKWADMYDAEVARIHKKMETQKAKFFTMSPEDTAWFVKTVKEGSWGADMKRFSPDIVTKFRSLIAK